MNPVLISLLIIMQFTLGGCTLLQMRDDNARMDISIPQKQQQLAQINAENDQLNRQTQTLTQQQQALNTEYDSLHRDYQALRGNVEGMTANTQQEKQKLKQLKNDVASLRKRIKSVETMPQGTTSEIKSKQDLIRKLNEEIHTRLQMGLN